MNTLDVDQARLRRYLLGELPEEERLALEERYFAADDVFAGLLAAEDELAEAYLSGALSAAERERYERVFLSTPAGRRTLRLAEDLGGRLSLRPPRPRAASARWRHALGPAAIAAAVVVAAAAGIWVTTGRDRGHPTLARTAERPAPRPVAPSHDGAPSPGSGSLEARPLPAPGGAILSVMLAAGLVRDAGPSKAFAIPPETTTVRLVLLLPRDDYPRYRVSLQTPEGDERMARSGLTPRHLDSGPGIEARFPARRLEPGTYVAIVSGVMADGRTEPAGEYVFRVIRPIRRAVPSPATYLAPPDHMWAGHDFSERG